MSNAVDLIVIEAFAGLRPMEQSPVALSSVFESGNFHHMRIDYEALMESAVRLRRERIADDRAEAVEAAYDVLLRSATDGKWLRVGEVCVNRQEGLVTALCVENNTLQLVG